MATTYKGDVTTVGVAGEDDLAFSAPGNPVNDFTDHDDLAGFQVGNRAKDPFGIQGRPTT